MYSPCLAGISYEHDLQWDMLLIYFIFLTFFSPMCCVHRSRYSRCSSSFCGCGHDQFEVNQRALWIGPQLGETDSYHTLHAQGPGHDSHSAAAHGGGTEASENNPNAETMAVTVGTPVSRGPKQWGEGKLLRQERKWDGRSRRVTGMSLEHVQQYQKTLKSTIEYKHVISPGV